MGDNFAPLGPTLLPWENRIGRVQSRGQTSRLLDGIGPVSRFGENFIPCVFVSGQPFFNIAMFFFLLILFHYCDLIKKHVISDLSTGINGVRGDNQ